MLGVALTWRGDVGAQTTGSGLVFGPKVYVRTTGSPNQFDDRFTYSGPPQQPFTLHIVNGDERGGHRVSSATITLGGTTIAAPRDFSKQIATVDRAVVLAASNTLHVRLTSEPGSFLTISIVPAPRPPPINQAPVVSAGPAQTITLPADATLTGSVTDDGLPAGATLSSMWTVVSGPGSVVFQNAERPATTATFGEAGRYVLRLTATDTQLASFSDVTITVNPEPPPPPPVNHAPVVSAGAAQTITMPASATLAGSVSDDGLPVGAVVTSTWSKFSGPGTVTFENAASPTTSAAFSEAGSYVLRLTASDTQLTSFGDVTITVNPEAPPPPPPPVNQPPSVSAGGAQTITMPASATLAGSVSDDGLPVGAVVTSTWSKFSGPGTVTFQNAASPTTSATFSEAGGYVLRLTASDTQLTSFSDVTITVNRGNAVPTSNPGGPYFGLVGESVAFDGSHSSDPDGDSLTYSWTFGDGGTGTGPNPTHTYSNAAQFTVTLTVSDGNGGTNSATVFVTVTQPNRAPTVTAGGPYSGSTRAAIAFSADASDPDGDVLTFTWDFGDGSAQASGQYPTHRYTAPGTYTASVTARDTTGATASASAPVTIVIVNSPPAFTSSAATTAKHQVPYIYQATAVDPDGDGVTFTLSQAPTGMTVGAQTGLLEWTPTTNQLGNQTVTLVATDAYQASVTQSFTVAVADATAPTVTLALPSEALPGAVVVATATATDNIGVVSVTFDVNGADPSLVSADPFQRSISVPRTALAGTEFHVRAIAQDAAGNVNSADRTFKVAALPDVQPPVLVLHAPGQAAPGATIQVTASGTDNVGVKTVTFKIGDTLLQADPDAPYETAYTIPADVVVGTIVTFSARATDFSNNFSDASAQVTLVAAPDTTPPHVQLIADSGVQEGGALALAATADDNVGVAKVTFLVNGVQVGVAATAPYAASYVLPPSASGGDLLHLEARAIDFSGNEASNSADAVVIPAPNRPPTATAGGPYGGEAGDAIALDGSPSSDPDERDRLTYDWNFGDQTTGSGRSPIHVYATEGTYTATLTVRDGRGGTSTDHASVVITPPTDRAPPSISLAGPSSVLPGAQVTMTAQASDNKGVVSVSFDVNGTDSSETATPPFQRVVNVPVVATPGDIIKVHATARDAAGNSATAESSLTITGTADTQKPAVALNVPAQVGAGAVLHLSATANDDVGVATVEFVVNGISLATVPAPPYETLYPVPADAVPGSSIGVVAHAADYSGNMAASEAAVQVTQTSDADTALPVVTLTAPLQVFAGKSLPLSASASDNVGVASVAFFVDGTNVATLNAAPYAITFPLSSAHAVGSVLKLEVKAVDYSGLSAIDSAQTLVVSTASAGQGSVTGEVYDDGTSLPIAGADVRLTGQDSSGTDYTQATTTDSRGRWTLNASEGQGVVQISKAGWTRVDRAAHIAVNQAIELFDARLTRVSPTTQSLSAVLGGTIASGPDSLTLAPGALATATALTLTPISAQALEGVLPPGWSPLAAADIGPHGVGFSAPASLSLTANVAPSLTAPIVVATWDDQAAVWRALNSIVAPSSGPLVSNISSSGQYALLVADTLPASPPPAIVGQALSGVVLASLDAAATTLVDPQPRILFYQPGVQSVVHGAISSAQPTSSGLPIETRLTESYQFFDGTSLRPEPFVEDLFFYQAAASPSALSGAFAVTPSQSFDPLTLQLGTISVELLAPPLGQRFVTTVGSDGGSVPSGSGATLQLPQGALTGPLPISVRQLTASTVGVTMPDGIDLVGAALVSFSGSLSRSASLSVPKPSGSLDATRLLLVRTQEIDGQTKLVLVARAAVVGNQIVSDTALGTTGVALEGVRVPGRYLFVRVGVPIGFATGTVTASGAPVSGALVSTLNLPIVALAGAAGRYVAAAATGAVTMTALDLQKSDVGTATGLIASAGAVAPIDIAIVAAAPAVTSIIPADGATNVPLSSPVVVRFSRAIDPSSVNGANAGSVVLTGPDGSPIAASVSLGGSNGVLTLRPSAALQASTTYTITIGTAVADAIGRHLASPVVAHFTSFDTAPPPMPAAGNITASIPDTDGFITISATQGTAGTHDTVTIVNLMRNTTTPVLLDPNGGFSVRAQAAVSDKLQIVITGTNGSQTMVPVTLFRQVNVDGSISQSVTAAGGHIDGPAGTAIDVAQDTFPSGAVVTIKEVTENQIPVTLTAEQQAVFPYAGAFQLDFGGAEPTRYINVSIPARSTDTTDDQWVVSQVASLNGQNVLNMVDTAKLINGRVRTSSPPCPGVLAAGVYAVYRTSKPISIAYGSMSSSTLLAAGISNLGGLAIPFGTYTPGGPIKYCLAALTGRVTIVENKTELIFSAEQIESTDSIFVIKNNKTGAVTTFARNELEFRFDVPGTISDTFVAKVMATGTAAQQVEFRPAESTTPGHVQIILGGDALIRNLDSLHVINTSTTPAQDTVFPAAAFAARLTVAGEPGFVYDLKANDVRPLLYTFYSAMTGNRALKVSPGTLDPSEAECLALGTCTGPAGKRRQKVELVIKSGATVTRTLVPDTLINFGGVTYPFIGNAGDLYSVEETFVDNSFETFEIPRFNFTVTDVSGVTLSQTVYFSPPKGEVLNLKHTTNDVKPPRITTNVGIFSLFDPSDFLQIQFSESLDRASVMTGFQMVDTCFSGVPSGTHVPGEIRLTNLNRTLTYVPEKPLAFGTCYTIFLTGLKDLGGNLLPPSMRKVEVHTILPAKQATLLTTMPTGLAFGLKSLQVLTKATPPSTTVFAVTDTDHTKPGAFRLVSLDVANPANPSQAGGAFGGAGKQRITLVPDIHNLTLAKPNECPPTTTTFSGDMAVTTSNTEVDLGYTFVQFFDVTNRTQPCLMGGKILTVDPTKITGLTQKGTVHAQGTARGVAALAYAPGHLAVYTAVENVGLFATEVGANIPEKAAAERTLDAMLPLNVNDVAAAGQRLLATDVDTYDLLVVDSNLNVLSSVVLPSKPFRIHYVAGLPFDEDHDGDVSGEEFINAAFVGCLGKVVLVDVTDSAHPRIVSVFPLPSGTVVDLDVDPGSRRLFAAGASDWYVIDLSRPPSLGLIDTNADGQDDRIMWRRNSTTPLQALKVDPDSKMVYVGTTKGLETYRLGRPNLTGTAKFTFFPAVPLDPATGVEGINYGAGEQRPIRGAIVELQNAAGTVLQTTNTDENGFYAFDAPVGVGLNVVVRAALGVGSSERVRVIDNVNTPGHKFQQTYTVRSLNSPFPMSGPREEDILAETRWDPIGDGIKIPNTNINIGRYEIVTNPDGTTRTIRDAAPFAILDTIFTLEHALLDIDPATTFPQLTVGWSSENSRDLEIDPVTNVGTKNVAKGLIGGAFYSHDADSATGTSARTLYLSGLQNSDTDEYDQDVVAHEWMHYMLHEVVGRSDDPGGTHRTNEKIDPRLAFEEAFATVFGKKLLGEEDPHYVDTNTFNQAHSIFAASLDEDRNDDGGFFSEGSVEEILWDLVDPTSVAENDADVAGLGIAFIPDQLMLDLRYLHRTMVQFEKTSPAYITIVNFLQYLKQIVPQPTLIDALALAENIDLSGASYFDVKNTKPILNANPALTVGPLYNLVEVSPANAPAVTSLFGCAPLPGGTGPGDIACSAQVGKIRTELTFDPNNDGNKLREYVFFWFAVPANGDYVVTVKPDAASVGNAFYLEVNNRGITKKEQKKLAFTDQLDLEFPGVTPGLYSGTVRVKQWSGSDWVPAAGAFTIEIHPK